MRHLIVELKLLTELTALDYASQLKSFKAQLAQAKQAKSPPDIQYWSRMLHVLQMRARRFLTPAERQAAVLTNPTQMLHKLARQAPGS